MSYTDFTFPIFLLSVALLYFTLFRRHQKILLLAASIAFYLFSGPLYIIYVLGAALTVYAATRLIQRLHDKEGRILESQNLSRPEKNKIIGRLNAWRIFLMLLGLFIMLGILIVVKYANFAAVGISALLLRFGINWSQTFYFVLPLGISFYTFMAVGYLLDIYWARYEADRNFFNVLLFLIYFPQIIEGPIGRYNRLSPQFNKDHPFDHDRVAKGAQLFLWGAFEKLAIANRLGVFVDGVYSKWNTLRGVPLILGIIFFSMQLYLDFQGCMDMGRGASQIFGIELDINFKRPYFSKNMAEFWRRWHITLGTWFKDYMLYPISLSKFCKRINKLTRKLFGRRASRALATVIPTACVWIVTGLWHGAAINYLIWGIYHGIILIVSTLTEHPVASFTKSLKIKTDTFSFNLFCMIRTFIISAVGRIFFLAGDFDTGIQILLRTFDFTRFSLISFWDKSLYTYGLGKQDFALTIILIILIWIVDNLQERMVIRDVIGAQNIVFRWILYLALLVGLALFGMYGVNYDPSSFVYRQF